MKPSCCGGVRVALALAVLVAGSPARAAECTAGTKLSDACLGLAYEGCCEAGGAAAWCETPAGPTCRYDCAVEGQACGWAGGYYWCGGEGADPSGVFGYDCPPCEPPCEAGSLCAYGTCVPCSCGDNECGVDPCGNPCGDCGPDATCTQGQCVPIPTCHPAGPIACDQQVEGNTGDGVGIIAAWTSCGAEADGPEVAFAFVPGADDQVQIVLEGGGALRAFLLAGSCRGTACVADGADGIPWHAVTAGQTYYVVVDTSQAATAHYSMSLRCQSTCVPACQGKVCGDDGCGGQCGPCEGACLGGACYATGGCAPEALTGSAGCPGCDCEACACALDEYCCLSEWDVVCQGECASACGGCGALAACGDGTCAGAETCAICPTDCACDAGQVCTPHGACCLPDCGAKACGDDGCGGSCGVCEAPWQCDGAGLCSVCLPQCDGRQCGDDQCLGTCGQCLPDQVCDADGQCACAPRCDGKPCGDDGCGGSCGACAPGTVCTTDGCGDAMACEGTEPDLCLPECETGQACDGSCACTLGACLYGECARGLQAEADEREEVASPEVVEEGADGEGLGATDPTPERAEVTPDPAGSEPVPEVVEDQSADTSTGGQGGCAVGGRARASLPGLVSALLLLAAAGRRRDVATPRRG